jgi:hypothetical protein
MVNELTILHFQLRIKQEIEKYKLALATGAKFFELKLIQNKIRELENILHSMQNGHNKISPGCQTEN